MEATAEATAEAATVGAAGASGPSVAWSDVADMGRILVAANGMTLYMFDKDAPGVSNCYGECAGRWPPLLVAAGEQPSAAEGISAVMGVTERTDGTYQVTANGWPLYFWWKDVNPGDATGQAVGDVWWVMSPDGTPMRAAAEATMEATAEATAEATMEAAPAAEAAVEAAPAPQQMPVTGSDGGLLSSILTTALTLGGLLAGGGWLALRRKR